MRNSDLELKWETLECGDDNNCWCKMIVNENFKDTKAEEDIIIGSGYLSESEAKYFVDLHNAYLSFNNQPRKKGQSIPYSEEDYQLLYGDKKWEVGMCFIDDGHFYKQNKDSVLHIFKDLINLLHVGALNDRNRDLAPISNEEFGAELARVKKIIGL